MPTPNPLPSVPLQGEKGDRGEAVSALVTPCHQLVALGGLHPPNHANTSSQGMLTTGFVSAGTARTYGTTGSLWSAGNILMQGAKEGQLPREGSDVVPMSSCSLVPLSCWWVGAGQGHVQPLLQGWTGNTS